MCESVPAAVHVEIASPGIGESPHDATNSAAQSRPAPEHNGKDEAMTPSNLRYQIPREAEKRVFKTDILVKILDTCKDIVFFFFKLPFYR